MKTRLVIWSLIILLFSCPSCNNNKKDTTPPVPEQLNITILLDLSDRLTQDMQPCQKDRDIAIVTNIVEIFKSKMDSKGTISSLDKLKIIFTPTPNDASINNIAKTLAVDLSKMDISQKKEVFDNITKNFSTGLNEIYDLTLESENWIGADIWHFFKYDANQYCISEDTSYRNILVIVTDGYLYHDQSKDRNKNRTAYITNSYFRNEGFINNPNWKEKFETNDYGLIFSGQTYENLDILVLEVNPSSTHRNDEDIIRAYLNKWFSEMKINHFEIHNTDLPVNTKTKIERFF